jgi:hypothetical protein
MFRGDLLWRGIVYAILMALAKCLTGLWLTILPPATGVKQVRKALRWRHRSPRRTTTILNEEARDNPNESHSVDSTTQCESEKSTTTKLANRKITEMSIDSDATLSESAETPKSPPPAINTANSKTDRNKVLYPSVLLGLCMMTRGEIGFLVAAVAQSAGVINPPDVYVVIIWAIVLCTLFGPIGVGLIVWKIKRLENRVGDHAVILGRWG